MAKSIQFTRQDTLHAAIGVIPAFLLICFGYLTPGIAFAIGLLPTSLLGIAPSRKLRLIYGLLGCLFGVGVYVGSYHPGPSLMSLAGAIPSVRSEDHGALGA